MWSSQSAWRSERLKLGTDQRRVAMSLGKLTGIFGLRPDRLNQRQVTINRSDFHTAAMLAETAISSALCNAIFMNRLVLDIVTNTQDLVTCLSISAQILTEVAPTALSDLHAKHGPRLKLCFSLDNPSVVIGANDGTIVGIAFQNGSGLPLLIHGDPNRRAVLFNNFDPNHAARSRIRRNEPVLANSADQHDGEQNQNVHSRGSNSHCQSLCRSRFQNRLVAFHRNAPLVESGQQPARSPSFSRQIAIIGKGHFRCFPAERIHDTRKRFTDCK